MMDYVNLAKGAVTSLADGAFLFPVLTYGVALMSAGALLLTLAHLLPLGAKNATRWAVVAVWVLVALAAGGAQLIAGDELKAAFDMGLEATEHEKIAQHKTLLMWAWAAPLPAVALVLLAAAPKSGGLRFTGLLLAVLLGAGASVYALTLVHAHQRTANMSYELTVEMQADLPDAWKDRLDETLPSSVEDEAETPNDAAPLQAEQDGRGDTEADDKPAQFFGIPVQ